MGNSCQCDAEGSPTRGERRSESSASVGGADLSDGDFVGLENIELEDFRITLVRKVFQDARTEHSIPGNEVPFRILIEKTLKINDAESILGSETFQRLSKHKAVDEEEALTLQEFIYFLEQQTTIIE